MSSDIIPDKPGIYYGLDFEIYKRINAINSSRLKLAVGATMKHVKPRFEREDEDTKAKAFGRLAHAVLLEPERLANVIGPKINKSTGEPYGIKTKAAQEHAAGNPGKTIASEDDIAHCVAIVEAVAADHHAGPILEFAKSQKGSSKRLTEVTLVWERDGVLCKARIDILRTGVIFADIKTIAGSGDAAIQRAIRDHKYAFSWAMYRDGLMRLGFGELDFAWVFVETNGSCAVRTVSPATKIDVEEGYAKYAIAEPSIEVYEDTIQRYAECVRTGRWPGYEVDPSRITPMGYFIDD